VDGIETDVKVGELGDEMVDGDTILIAGIILLVLSSHSTSPV
jgi:hypothetical protein